MKRHRPMQADAQEPIEAGKMIHVGVGHEGMGHAQQLARDRGHQQIIPLHLLKALLDDAQGVVRPLLQKIGIQQAQLESMIDGELKRIPKVTGGGGDVGASSALMQVLDKAQEQADSMRDDFVSTGSTAWGPCMDGLQTAEKMAIPASAVTTAATSTSRDDNRKRRR